MRRKGKGEALRIDTRVSIGEDKQLNSLPGRDFTYNKRLFRCTRNSVLYLLVPFLLLLLSNNYKEGKAYRASASSRTLPSINLWILTNLLKACDIVILFSSPKIGLSILLKFKKQERQDASLYTFSSLTSTITYIPSLAGVFDILTSFANSGIPSSPLLMSSTYSAARIPSKISVISISRSTYLVFASYLFI